MHERFGNYHFVKVIIPKGLRPKLSGQFQRLLGSLLAAHPPEECFTRVLANAVHLGMYVERRISPNPPFGGRLDNGGA